MPYVGQLTAVGLAKETTVGTLVTPPTEFIPSILPDSFMPSIQLLESAGVYSIPDKIRKATQGPGEVKGMKLKWEAEPENIGNLLMGTFGTDTPAESASFVVGASNNKIDFKESGGAQLNATIASGTYAMGSSSAVNLSLCKAVKTALDAAGGTTYTVTYNSGTKKLTITPTAGTLQILWLTGTNQATAAYAVLGWTHADTTNAASQTSDSTTAIQVWAHTFTRLAAAQLPTYSWWFNKGAKYMQFLGSMVNKLEITAKARDFVYVDSEWTALTYDDNGSSQTPSYSTVKPWKFNQMVVSIDSGAILNYDNVKITFDNMVKADHVLNSSIYPGKIYSEGWEVTVSLDLVVENSTEYAKFLAGTDAALNFVLTSTDDISGAYAGTKYKLTIDIPTVKYSVASYPSAPGLIKIAFTARGIYTTASTKTVSAALVNSVSATY